MMKFWTLLTIWALAAGSGHAQNPSNETDPASDTSVSNEIFIEQTIPEPPTASGQISPRNFVHLLQEGQEHTAWVSQKGMNNHGIIWSFGNGHLTKLSQEGTGNQVFMEIYGNRNKISGDQYGAENLFTLELAGDDHQLNLIQEGDGNMYERILIGNTQIMENVLQRGNNNRSIQIGSLDEGRSASITQEGDGMQLMIRHER